MQRRLAGRIISRFEEKGLNIVAMKMLQVTPALAKQHYAEHVSKPFYPGLEAFITASPIVAMVVEGLEVIRVVREMLGATSGLKASAAKVLPVSFACVAMTARRAAWSLSRTSPWTSALASS